jgi:hypothetical protein
MQMICALLIFQDPVLPCRLTDLSPWLDMQTAPLAEVVRALEAQSHRRFIKTHTPLDGLPFDERVTYVGVGRDPRDVALSFANHFDNMNLEVLFSARAEAVGLDDLAELMPEGPPAIPADLNERFGQWVQEDFDPGGGTPCLALTVHHLGTFWDRRSEDNIVLFHYSDLQADLAVEMRRLADSLGIAVDEEAWPTLVSAASFQSMRSRADELAPAIDVAGFWHSNTSFFNKGANGQWRAVIRDEQLRRYEIRLRELAAPDLAQWATNGRCGIE